MDIDRVRQRRGGSYMRARVRVFLSREREGESVSAAVHYKNIRDVASACLSFWRWRRRDKGYEEVQLVARIIFMLERGRGVNASEI